MFITHPMNVLFTLDSSLTRCVSNCPQLRLLSLLAVDDFITKTYNAEFPKCDNNAFNNVKHNVQVQTHFRNRD